MPGTTSGRLLATAEVDHRQITALRSLEWPSDPLFVTHECETRGKQCLTRALLSDAPNASEWFLATTSQDMWKESSPKLRRSPGGPILPLQLASAWKEDAASGSLRVSHGEWAAAL